MYEIRSLPDIIDKVHFVLSYLIRNSVCKLERNIKEKKKKNNLEVRSHHFRTYKYQPYSYLLQRLKKKKYSEKCWECVMWWLDIVTLNRIVSIESRRPILLLFPLVRNLTQYPSMTWIPCWLKSQFSIRFTIIYQRIFKVDEILFCKECIKPDVEQRYCRYYTGTYQAN